MAIPVIMPRFGQGQEEATIVEWFKEEGEYVTQGEPLLSVETDKTVMDVETPVTGVLLKVKCFAQDVVPVAWVIAYIGEPGEEVVEDELASDEKEALAVAPAGIAPAPVEHEAHPKEQPGKVKATPVARRLAKEKGIALASITGTGSGGLITREDVESFAQQLLPGESESVPVKGMRKTIAERMQNSWQTVPHFTLTVVIDMSAAEVRRAQWNTERVDGEPKLTVTGLLIAVAARLLSKHRYLNASLSGVEILLHPQINIGMAVALEEGLIVPVLKGADDLSLAQIAVQSRDLTERARAGKLTPDHVTGGTFTVSNLGMLGVRQFTAIINPPESAILAVGSLEPQVVPVGGMLAIRSMMTVTLSVDHRVVDGALAGRFLADMKTALERPEMLFD